MNVEHGEVSAASGRKTKRWVWRVVAGLLLVPSLLILLLVFTSEYWLNSEKVRIDWLSSLASDYGVSLSYQGLKPFSWAEGFFLRSLALEMDGVSVSLQNLSLHHANLTIDVLDVTLDPSLIPTSSEQVKGQPSSPSLEILSWLPNTYHIKQFTVSLPDMTLSSEVKASLSDQGESDIRLSGAWTYAVMPSSEGYDQHRSSAESPDQEPIMLKGTHDFDIHASLEDAWVGVRHARVLSDGISLELTNLQANQIFSASPQIENAHVQAQLESSLWPKPLQQRLSSPLTAEFDATFVGSMHAVSMLVNKLTLKMPNMVVKSLGEVHVSMTKNTTHSQVIDATLQDFSILGWSAMNDSSSQGESDRLFFSTKLDAGINYQLETGGVRLRLRSDSDVRFDDWVIKTLLKTPQLDWTDKQLSWQDLSLKSSASYQQKPAISMDMQLDGLSDLTQASMNLDRFDMQLTEFFPATAESLQSFAIRLASGSIEYRKNGEVIWLVDGELDVETPSYRTHQAELHTQGSWLDGLLHLTSFDLNDHSNQLVQSTSGVWQSSDEVLQADLKGAIHFSELAKPMVPFLPAYTLSGAGDLHWQLQRDPIDQQALQLSGDLRIENLDVEHDSFELEGVKIHLPFREKILRSTAGFDMAAPDPFTRLAVPAEQSLPGFINISALSLASKPWGYLNMGAAWRHGVLMLQPQDANLLGGDLAGNVLLAWPESEHGEADMLLHTRLSWIGIDSERLIDQSSGEKRGLFNIFATLDHQGDALQGRFSVLEMGKETTLNMIDWFDPKFENSSVQNAKEMMVQYGFIPAGIDAILKDRYLDVDLSLQSKHGKVTHIFIRNMAVTEYLDDMFE